MNTQTEDAPCKHPPPPFLTGFVLSMGLFTLSGMIAMPMQSAYVARIAPGHLRGRDSGGLGLAWCAASAVRPAAGMWIFATHHNALGSSVERSLSPQRQSCWCFPPG